MAMSTGTSNTLLGVLAVLAVGTSGYAVWSVHQPPEASEWTVQADTPSPTTDDDAAAATGEPTAADGTETTGEPADSLRAAAYTHLRRTTGLDSAAVAARLTEAARRPADADALFARVADSLSALRP